MIHEYLLSLFISPLCFLIYWLHSQAQHSNPYKLDAWFLQCSNPVEKRLYPSSKILPHWLCLEYIPILEQVTVVQGNLMLQLAKPVAEAGGPHEAPGLRTGNRMPQGNLSLLEKMVHGCLMTEKSHLCLGFPLSTYRNPAQNNLGMKKSS